MRILGPPTDSKLWLCVFVEVGRLPKGAVDSRTLRLYRTHERDVLYDTTGIHELPMMLLIATFELDVNLPQHLSHRGEHRHHVWQTRGP